MFTTQVEKSEPIYTVDPDLSNNEAQCTIHVTAVADLKLTKTDTPDPVYTDRPPNKPPTLLYTLNVTNYGPSTAVNVVVRDVLPADVMITSITCSKGSCNFGVPGDSTRPTTWTCLLYTSDAADE